MVYKVIFDTKMTKASAPLATGWTSFLFYFCQKPGALHPVAKATIKALTWSLTQTAVSSGLAGTRKD